jgi:tellurite resistance protein TerC
MDIPLSVWIATVAGLILLVALDFVLISRKPHDVGFREALGWSVFYVAIAVAFGVALLIWESPAIGSQFFTAYLVEKSLSVDNLFVFLIILTQFRTPSNLHQRVLLVGVILALVLRTILIAVGAVALAYFSFTFVIFGGFLIWTGVQLFRHRNDDPDPSDDNALVRVIRRRVPITDDYHGTKLSIRVDGRRVMTPLLLVMVAIGSTDLLFALDSIPATFGVTQEAFLVFSANAFALLGLRALFFLLKGLLDKLVYLSAGLAVILIFIGIKLVLEFASTLNASIPHISVVGSLGFIIVVLVVVAVASWLKVRRDPQAIAHAGTVTEPHESEDE